MASLLPVSFARLIFTGGGSTFVRVGAYKLEFHSGRELTVGFEIEAGGSHFAGVRYGCF